MDCPVLANITLKGWTREGKVSKTSHSEVYSYRFVIQNCWLEFISTCRLVLLTFSSVCSPPRESQSDGTRCLHLHSIYYIEIIATKNHSFSWMCTSINNNYVCQYFFNYFQANFPPASYFMHLVKDTYRSVKTKFDCCIE